MDLNAYVPIHYAYIDPGTGSMLFTILIGAISVAVYWLKGVFIRSKYLFSRDKSKITAQEASLPIVIYCDDKRYWNTFKPICDELEKRKQKAYYLSQSEDDPAFKNDYEFVKCEFIGEGNKGIARLNTLSADLFLSTTPSLDVYQWKRSKNVKYYIHVLHMPNDVTSYRMFGIDYYDALILSGAFQEKQVRQLEELRKLPPKELKILGLPYLDELSKRRKSAKQDDDKVTVLLAPSWGPSGILSRYGSKMIDALIATGYEVIIRPHPQSFVSEKPLMDELMNAYPDLEWNRDNDNFEVLNRSDIMISDFSGVIFDFSLVFDKPVIYADVSFDKGIYDAWWLEDEMWTFEVLPKIGSKLESDDLDNMKQLIDGCLNNKELQKSRREVKKECWANPGKSASLIADYLIEKHQEITGNNKL